MTDEMTEEMEAKAENCRLAMKAAMEAIQDYCGTGEPEHGRYIKFAGEIIEYPDSVHEIMADPELTGDEQIKEMSETPWAEETARKLCEEMFEGAQPEVDACTKRLKQDLASAVLFQRLKWVKKE